MDKIHIAANYIRNKTNFVPEIAIVLGSGLGAYKDTLQVEMEFNYSEIPGFPEATAPAHAGKLILGKKEGKNIALYAGRFHCYEGYSAAQTVIPLRTAFILGVKYVILTNASGGIREDLLPGDLLLLTDHINLSTHNPLTGSNKDELGVRFPDMSFAYSNRMNELVSQSVRSEKDIELKAGIYAYMIGPSYETPAEIRALKILGADVVGMSTVHEVVACVHAGVEVMAISCVSNLAAGISKNALTEEEVIQTGQNTSRKMRTVLDIALKEL